MSRVDVTKTFLPPEQEYAARLKAIWVSNQITNQGPELKSLEASLKKYLEIEDMQLVANGTLALQLAINLLGIKSGEIITTPFTYVASTSAVLWQNCNPVFVDIDDSLNIDPSKIEAAITKNTKAILAVHVFGNPCDIEAIDKIAKKHDLPVIYDAAHAFGVKYKDKSLYSYGDISTASFHATKLFHTVEGGAVVCHDKKLNEKLDLTKRFGHWNDNHLALGINAKMSELHAAMGNCNLKYINEIIDSRRKASELYDSKIKLNVERPKIAQGTEPNYSYYPVILKSENALLKVLEKLTDQDIYPRRYFYPSLNKLSYLNTKQSCPVSEDISTRILCLPLYHDVDEQVIDKVCEVINEENN